MKLKIIMLHFIFFCTSSIFPKMFITSVPKCGTHLVMRCIELLSPEIELTGAVDDWLHPSKHVVQNLKEEHCLVTHATACDVNFKIFNRENLLGIFIYRDPRDQIASAARYMKSSSRWDVPDIQVEELIAQLIYDYSVYYTSSLPALENFQGGIKEFYNLFMPWSKKSFIYTTQFEKLIGPLGGGSTEQQLIEIANIAHHLGLDVNEEKIKKVSEQLFGKTTTFNEGQIGNWKNYFSEKNKQLFKKLAGQLLIDLGYEKDFNW